MVQCRWHEAHYTPVEFCAPVAFSSCTAVCRRPLLLEGNEVLPKTSGWRSRLESAEQMRNSFEIEPNARFSQEEAGSARVAQKCRGADTSLQPPVAVREAVMSIRGSKSQK